MNNIYTVVPCRTYKVTATQPCTLTDGHGLTLELTPGTPATFEAHTAEIHTTAPVALEVAAGGAPSGKYVTVQVLGVKKVVETLQGGTPFTHFETSATGWQNIDPQGPLADWLFDCNVQCAPGWLYRELHERPTATGEANVALVGWEFVLRAGEEDFLLAHARAFARVLEEATEGVNSLHIKLIYHD